MEQQSSTWDPRPIGRFRAGEHLHEGWRVKRYLPGTQLHLERERQEQTKRMKRQLGAIAVSLLLVALLWVGTQRTTGHLGWVTYPLVGLFLLVAALGVLALGQSLRQLRQGVRLRLDREQSVVEGILEADRQLGLRDYQAGLHTQPLDRVERVAVRVFPQTGPAAHEPRLRAQLVVMLKGQSQGLLGPAAWSVDGRGDSARDALCPLAVELARVAKCPLQVEYPDEGGAVTLEAQEVLALPPGAPYSER